MPLCYYLTHPQVAIDPDIPVPNWSLSARGRERLAAAADARWLHDCELIVSSTETKARETSAMIAERTGAAIIERADTHENDRSATGFLPPAEFEMMADHFFGQPTISIRGWERAIDAQMRIVGALNELCAQHPDRRMLLVGHGGVGTLLMCHLGELDISRRHDQPANGGGNVFAFDTSTPCLLHQWCAIEDMPQSIAD